MTLNESSTLAVLLVGAETVEHYSDEDGQTRLKFSFPDKPSVWIMPAAQKLLFCVEDSCPKN